MFFTVSNFLHFLYHMTISDDGRMCRGLKRFIIRDEHTGLSKRIDSHKVRLFTKLVALPTNTVSNAISDNIHF